MTKKRYVSYQNVDNLKFSQNFITNTKLLKKLVGFSNLSKKDTVIEIGAGKGHLTRVLSAQCKHICAIELDFALYKKTKEKLAGLSNLDLIYGDFLDYDLPKDGHYTVFSNIPYCITTKIVQKLTQAPNPPQNIWLTMEKSAAKRFMGLPRENKKSLLLKAHWDMAIRYHFRAEDFHPKPGVASVLIHFRKKDQPDLTKNEWHAFAHFLDHSFRYGLLSKKSLLTKKQIAKGLQLAGLPAIQPYSKISYAQWLCLFKCRQKFLPG